VSGFFQTLLEALSAGLSDADREVIGPRAPVVMGPKPTTTVTPPARQAWDEKRWQRQLTSGQAEVVGAYQVFDRRQGRWRHFKGRLMCRSLTTTVRREPAGGVCCVCAIARAPAFIHCSGGNRAASVG